MKAERIIYGYLKVGIEELYMNVGNIVRIEDELIRDLYNGNLYDVNVFNNGNLLNNISCINKDENQTLYFGLYDLQTSRYLQTGLNSTDIDTLINDFVDYISVDFDNTEIAEKDDEQKYLDLANGDYDKAVVLWYKDYFKNRPLQLFDMWEFVLEIQTEKFEEEEY